LAAASSGGFSLFKNKGFSADAGCSCGLSAPHGSIFPPILWPLAEGEKPAACDDQMPRSAPAFKVMAGFPRKLTFVRMYSEPFKKKAAMLKQYQGLKRNAFLPADPARSAGTTGKRSMNCVCR